MDKNTSSPADVKCSSNEEESHVENNSSDPTIDHCAKSPTENEGVKDFDKSSQNKDDESEKNGKDDLCMESTATRDINDDVKNSTPASSKTERLVVSLPKQLHI